MTGVNLAAATTRLLSLVVVTAALSACGGSVSVTPEVPGPTFAQAAPGDLVGTWRVSAPGEAPDTAVQFGGGLTLLRDCGLIKGRWRATAAGDVVMRVYDASQPCGGTGSGVIGDYRAETPEWMLATAALGRESGGLVLLDRAGTVTAELTPVLAADADGATTLLGADPELDSGNGNVIALPPVPEGLSADVGDLKGEWMYPDPRARGRLVIDDQGRETYSDGCNGGGGFTFRVPLGAAVISMPAGGTTSTLALCGRDTQEGYPSTWVWADAAGTLVFTNDDGVETGRFVRAETVFTTSPTPTQ